MVRPYGSHCLLAYGALFRSEWNLHPLAKYLIIVSFIATNAITDGHNRNHLARFLFGSYAK